MINSKRGQFFLIFAVIIGVLLLFAATQINRATGKNNLDTFQISCDNYKTEIFKISQYAIANDKKSEEFSLLSDFSKAFFSHMNDSYDSQMFILYGNSNKFTFSNFSSGSVQDYLSKENIDITLNGITKTYNFNKDDVFYFYLKSEKGGEVYVCE